MFVGGIPGMDAQSMMMNSMASVNGNSTAMGTNGNNFDTDDANKHNLANTKEKTPMCLVNELARYNKVREA